MNRVNLYELDFEEVEALLATWGFDRQQARELWRRIYRRLEVDFFEMTPLPRELRARLAEKSHLYVPPVVASQTSSDGATRKDLLHMVDGEGVEVVFLHYRHRHSACISTQVGCTVGCAFCATGQMGFGRNLTSAEVVEQVVYAQRTLAEEGESLSNFVLMGMGEPLLNYENVLAALRRLTDPRGMGFVERRITLSTVGIPKGIERLAEEGLRVNLAVSLHAATDELRTQLVPINARYPLAELFAALDAYTQATGRRVMYEWVLVGGVTDTPEQAEALGRLLEGRPAHVNLIRLNPTEEFPAEPTTPQAVEVFEAALDAHDVPHTLRRRKGREITAGCGQLRGREG